MSRLSTNNDEQRTTEHEDRARILEAEFAIAFLFQPEVTMSNRLFSFVMFLGEETQARARQALSSAVKLRPMSWSRPDEDGTLGGDHVSFI